MMLVPCQEDSLSCVGGKRGRHGVMDVSGVPKCIDYTWWLADLCVRVRSLPPQDSPAAPPHRSSCGNSRVPLGMRSDTQDTRCENRGWPSHAGRHQHLSLSNSPCVFPDTQEQNQRMKTEHQAFSGPFWRVFTVHISKESLSVFLYETSF